VLSNNEVSRRKSVFIEAFRRLRKRKPALREAKLKYEMWRRFMDSDPVFSASVREVEIYLNSTVRCSICEHVGDPSEFVNLNSSLTRSGRCKPCHSKRQVRRVQNDFGTKLVKLVQDAKARDPSASQLNVRILRDKYKEQGGSCFYTGTPLSHKVEDGMALIKHKKFSPMMSIDRVDPRRGYDPDNIVLCCLSINLMKGGLTFSAFLEACQRVLDHAQSS
jgi:hypothetical protein